MFKKTGKQLKNGVKVLLKIKNEGELITKLGEPSEVKRNGDKVWSFDGVDCAVTVFLLEGRATARYVGREQTIVDFLKQFKLEQIITKGKQIQISLGD